MPMCTWTVAAQHTGLNQRCWDSGLIKNTRVSTRQFTPRPGDQNLHTSLKIQIDRQTDTHTSVKCFPKDSSIVLQLGQYRAVRSEGV